ncbi:MAG: hypothetical protein UV68_C0065G0001 [Candidatus Collierbacteria bacterium GW2011_GWC2_43_12]|uniref:Uncharacterized protein n=1 Tax=Candidatus Collierbacteria bacterium GW2011_GWC2_43_12 TaxID=1618390 RepID=A0A0G1D1Q8_9BACT|nr:MAG: hypothetical protein UV68_C0065G0001 [Candidatus Collierbacteria bacterium GW2011_GWC2_43_12]
MPRLLYVVAGNIVGVVLGLLVGAILLIAMCFTAIKLSAVIGIAILVYVICFIVGILCAFIDPLKVD